MQRGLSYTSNLANTDYDKIFDVREFGASGNGISNDANAVQRAITAAESFSSRRVVFFPPGDYAINSGLGTTRSLHIKGSGSRTRLLLGTGVDGITYRPTVADESTTEAVGFKLLDIWITRQAGVTTGRGLVLDTGAGGVTPWHHNLIQGCNFTDLGGHGIFITNTSGTGAYPGYTFIDECLIIRSAGDGIRIADGGDHIFVDRSVINDSTGSGVDVNSASGSINFELTGSALVRNRTAGVIIRNSPQFKIINTDFEQQTIPITGANGALIDIQGDAASNISPAGIIANCNLNGNSNVETTSIIRMDRATGLTVMNNRIGGATNGIIFTANAISPLLIGNLYTAVTNILNNPPNSTRRIHDSIDATQPSSRFPLADNDIGLDLWSVQGNVRTFTVEADASGNVYLREYRSGRLGVMVSDAEQMRWVNPADGNVGFLVRVNRSGVFTIDQASYGGENSGGAGFRLLRVPN